VTSIIRSTTTCHFINPLTVSFISLIFLLPIACKNWRRPPSNTHETTTYLNRLSPTNTSSLVVQHTRIAVFLHASALTSWCGASNHCNARWGTKIIVFSSLNLFFWWLWIFFLCLFSSFSNFLTRLLSTSTCSSLGFNIVQSVSDKDSTQGYRALDLLLLFDRRHT